MKRRGCEKKRILREKCYPLLVSIVFTLIFIWITSGITIKDDISVAVNAVLVVVSILIGFVGVLVGLIFSQSDNDILSVVFDNENLLGLLKKYFMAVYRSGFLLLTISISILFADTIKEIVVTKFEMTNIFIESYMIYIWIFFLVYFTLATYRLIKIVVELIFQKNTKKNIDGREKEDYSDLENKYKIK